MKYPGARRKARLERYYGRVVLSGQSIGARVGCAEGNLQGKMTGWRREGGVRAGIQALFAITAAKEFPPRHPGVHLPARQYWSRPTTRGGAAVTKLALIGCGHWGPNHLRTFNSLPGRSWSAWSIWTPGAWRRCAWPIRRCAASRTGRGALEDPRSTRWSSPPRCAPITGSCGRRCSPASTCSARSRSARRPRRRRSWSSWPPTTTACSWSATSSCSTGASKAQGAGRLGQSWGRLYYLSAVRTNLGPIRSDANAAYDLAAHDISIFNWLLGGPNPRRSGHRRIVPAAGHRGRGVHLASVPGRGAGQHPGELAGPQEGAADHGRRRPAHGDLGRPAAHLSDRHLRQGRRRSPRLRRLRRVPPPVHVGRRHPAAQGPLRRAAQAQAKSFLEAIQRGRSSARMARSRSMSSGRSRRSRRPSGRAATEPVGRKETWSESRSSTCRPAARGRRPRWRPRCRRRAGRLPTSSSGPQVTELERAFAAFVGAAHAVGVTPWPGRAAARPARARHRTRRRGHPAGQHLHRDRPGRERRGRPAGAGRLRPRTPTSSTRRAIEAPMTPGPGPSSPST